MKHVLFILASLLAFACYADEGYGTCNISNSEYAEATAYINLSTKGLSGNLVITNHSGSPLQSASIRVTVNYSWSTTEYKDYEGNVTVNHTGSKTIYNTRWTGNIAAWQSGSVDLLAGNPIPSNGRAGRITSIDVSISNPICK